MDISNINRNTTSTSTVAEKMFAYTPPAPTGTSATQTVEAVTPPKAVVNTEDLQKAIAEINKSLKTSSQNLEFSIDNDVKTVVVKLMDLQTKEVIRQIPTVEALEIAKSLDKLKGLFFNQEA